MKADDNETRSKAFSCGFVVGAAVVGLFELELFGFSHLTTAVATGIATGFVLTAAAGLSTKVRKGLPSPPEGPQEDQEETPEDEESAKADLMISVFLGKRSSQYFRRDDLWDADAPTSSTEFKTTLAVSWVVFLGASCGSPSLGVTVLPELAIAWAEFVCGFTCLYLGYSAHRAGNSPMRNFALVSCLLMIISSAIRI